MQLNDYQREAQQRGCDQREKCECRIATNGEVELGGTLQMDDGTEMWCPGCEFDFDA